MIPFPGTFFKGKTPAEAGDEKEGSKVTGVEALIFSQEEINKMLKLKDGRARITPDGLYQIRYRRDGYNKQFTSKDPKIAKELFREWVKSVNDERKAVLPKKTQCFTDFARRYFETVKRQNVSAMTYETMMRTLQLHILPTLGDFPFRRITPMKCQELLNGLLDEGKGRTAESVKFLLSEIFRAAVGEGLLSSNPMQYVKIPRHIRENGSALSLDEIRAFIKACASSPYRKQFMLLLYTGIRRNELHGAIFNEDFIEVENGKRRTGQRKTTRRIPIAPGLKAFLPLNEEELAVQNDVLTGNFKKLCPAHHLYDLRHTFTTRALESGIAKELVDVWTAHADKRDMTASVYTHFSAEFQLKEIEKLDF